MNPTRRILLGGIAAGVLAVSTLSASAQTVIRFSNWVPPTHPVSTDVIGVWADRVKEATDGRVVVEVVSPLGNPPSHLDLVQNGVADAGFIVHGYTPERFPLTEGMELPFLADDSRSASIAYWKTYEKYLADANEHDGVKLIGLWVHGPAHFFTRDKEINTLDDMSGLKIRVGGGMAKYVAEDLGTVPFFAPASQSYEVISKGVADGIMFPTESVYNFKIGPAIGQALEVPGGLYRSSQGVVMNQAKWDALSPEDQAAIESVSGLALAELAAKMWDTQDALGREELIKGGTNFKTAEGALLDSIHDKLSVEETKWVEAGDGKVDRKAVLDYFKEQIAAAQ
jgi:TRAP-type C4-dicarboxylate transport system substrate-binding protein